MRQLSAKMSAMPPIELLRESDVAGALRLSSAAGWNQIGADWLRLIRLWPSSCFAMRDGGEVIATGTLAAYAALGWIGMILVDERRRGRGLATAMMNHLLAHADATGITTLGLDATELGRPIYHRLGFQDQREIVRWTSKSLAPSPKATRIAAPDDWRAIENLDRAAAGVDRARLLRVMASEPSVTARVIDRGGEITGFGLLRPGRIAAHIGPVIATSAEDAAAIVAALQADAASWQAEEVFIDVPADSRLVSHLAHLGFSPHRRLMRMTRPAAAALRHPDLHAAIGFELG